MKIAFATIYDAQDIRRGSGWPYFLSQELKNQGHNVHYMGPLSIHFPLATRIGKTLSLRLGRRYRSYQDPFSGRLLGRVVTQKLSSLDYDLLLTNDYAIAAYTQTDKPVIVYTDSMFPRYYADNVHPWLTNLSWWSVHFCQYVVRQGLQRADWLVFPATAIQKGAELYGIPATKVAIIPWGANFADPGPEVAAARQFTNIIKKKHIDLLFVGKDWHLKGGDIVVQVAQQLNDQGLVTRLHIVGTHPPQSLKSEWIHVYGLLDKSNPTDYQQLESLFRNCDAFILPSQAEGFGLVFAEAAAYGLPSLAYNTIGVESAVVPNQSGILLPLNAHPDAFVSIIQNWFRRGGIEYDQLVETSRQHFETSANWHHTVQTFLHGLEQQFGLT